MYGVLQQDEDADDFAADVKEEEDAGAGAGPSAAVRDEEAAEATETEIDEAFAGLLTSWILAVINTWAVWLPSCIVYTIVQGSSGNVKPLRHGATCDAD